MDAYLSTTFNLEFSLVWQASGPEVSIFGRSNCTVFELGATERGYMNFHLCLAGGVANTLPVYK